MTRQVNWDDVPDSDVLPKGLYQVVVESWQETENRHGHLMYKVTYRITEPVQYEGRLLFDNFSVGSAEMPDEVDPKSVGTGFLKKFFSATGVTRDPDIDRMWRQAEDQSLILAVDAKPGKNNDGSPGPLRNNVTRYYALGDRQPQIEIPAVAPTTNGAVPSSGSKVPRRMARAS